MSKVVINTTGDPVDDDTNVQHPGGLDAHTDDDKVTIDKAGEEGKESTKPREPNKPNFDSKLDNTDDNLDTSDKNDESGKDDVQLIEVDGEQYEIDESGNAVKDGEVVYTKEQLDSFEEPSGESIVKLEEIFKNTNIVPVDEKGEPIKYEDTPEGISSYVKDVYDIAAKQAIEEYQTSLFTTYPILNDVFDYLSKNNGSLENYTPKQSYRQVEITDDSDETQLKNIIVSARLQKGDTAEKAERYFKYLKDSNQVLEEAKSELEYLKDNETKLEESKRVEIQQQQEVQRKEAESYWGIAVDEKGQLIDLNKNDSIYGIIKTGELKVDNENYKIPDKIRIKQDGKIVVKDRNDFFRYIYEPVQIKNGNQTLQMTRYEYDLAIENNNRSIHNDVLDAFKRFVNYDLSQIVKDKVKQEEVKNVIKKISTKKRSASPKVTTGGKLIIPKTE